MPKTTAKIASKTATRLAKRLAAMRRELEATRTALESDLAQLAASPDDLQTVDFSEEGGDPDVVALERDRLRAQLAATRDHLDGVDAALAAIADGTYGTCRVCAATIPDERLDALPDTRLCVHCKAAGH